MIPPSVHHSPSNVVLVPWKTPRKNFFAAGCFGRTGLVNCFQRLGFSRASGHVGFLEICLSSQCQHFASRLLFFLDLAFISNPRMHRSLLRLRPTLRSYNTSIPYVRFMIGCSDSSVTFSFNQTCRTYSMDNLSIGETQLRFPAQSVRSPRVQPFKSTGSLVSNSIF
jgi:hypothetical protein